VLLCVTSDLAWQAGDRAEAVKIMWRASGAGTGPLPSRIKWVARLARHAARR
jgi:hypothetical protein